MISPAQRFSSLAFSAILLAFLGVYVVSLMSGAEPEMALLRGALAGVSLGTLARLAAAVIDLTPERRAARPSSSSNAEADATLTNSPAQQSESTAGSS